MSEMKRLRKSWWQICSFSIIIASMNFVRRSIPLRSARNAPLNVELRHLTLGKGSVDYIIIFP